MPGLSYVDRDYVNLHRKFISFGPVVRTQGIGAHGITWPVDDLYDELVRDRATEEWGGVRYPSIANAKDAANVILHLAPETNGESAFRAFAAEEKKVGIAAHRPRGREPQRPDDLLRPGPPAAPAPRQPLLDRHHRQRPHLLGLLPQRGAARSLANPDRAAALLPRPPGVHRLRGGAPHLQAEAGGGHRPRPGGLRGRPAEPAAQLPDPAREVGHPLHLRRQPPHAVALPRHPPALDERQGRGVDRARGQRLGRGLQRPRRGGGALRGLRAHPHRPVPALPRAGADHRRAEEPGARRQAGRRPQQPDAGALEAHAHAGRLRPVHLRPQLLGPHREQPGHLHPRAQARRSAAVLPGDTP